MNTTSRRTLLTGAAALLVLAGCSAADGTETPSSPSRLASAPAGGQLLRERGISHGPANMALPQGITVTRTIDQPNVVTLVFGPEDGRTVLDYLTLHAATLGLRDVQTGHESMVFTLDGWDGGLTTSSEIAGLTLRRQP
ncbi:hypothetical protein ACPCG0_06585 [Propionibacteriaceae bacterium Y1923]|uniref:hypothetical protein n=1 Tax=Aestuariimicrobium sp. Y1814 TaxID=3418742 RepID=UPI003C2060F2